jgi:hypothetical protein
VVSGVTRRRRKAHDGVRGRGVFVIRGGVYDTERRTTAETPPTSCRPPGQKPRLACPSLADFVSWHRLHTPRRLDWSSLPPRAFGMTWSHCVDGACWHTVQIGSRARITRRKRRHGLPYPRSAGDFRPCSHGLFPWTGHGKVFEMRCGHRGTEHGFRGAQGLIARLRPLRPSASESRHDHACRGLAPA